jgi:hypothetical protein
MQMTQKSARPVLSIPLRELSVTEEMMAELGMMFMSGGSMTKFTSREDGSNECAQSHAENTPQLFYLQPQQRRRPSTFLRGEGMGQATAASLIRLAADDECGEAIRVLVEKLRQLGTAHGAGAFADALGDLELSE